MRDKAREELDQQWFNEQIRRPLQQVDELNEPVTPELVRFEQLVKEHKGDIKRRQWRDITLLWLLGAFIFSSMMWLADQHPSWFIGMQAAAAAGAFLIMGASFSRRLSGKWKR